LARGRTVLRVRHVSRHQLVESVLLALAAAEGGVRLLSPRERPIEPAEIDLHSFFSDAEIERGARFARPQLALGLTRATIELGALALVVRRPPRWLSRQSRRPVLVGAATGAGLAVGLSFPTLPLSAISRRRGIAVGLVTQSWRGWAADLLKGAAIESVLAGAAGSAAVAVTRRYPRTWWLPAAGGSILFGAVLAALAPVVLDPVFNDFTPLPEGETRSDVLELAREAGVKVGEVYSIDASRRTTAANAYVTGLGPTKRVVLFDTLLDRYSRDEVRVVVAHELGHVRNRDVPRGVLYAALVAPAAALAVQRLSWELSPERGTAAALPALALAAALVGAPTAVIGNRLSRAIERRSDAYSLALTGAPDAFISFERAIAVQNVADLEPPRWLTSLLASHPPTAERIGVAVSFAGRSGNGAAPEGDR
jgi:STE24 endopeptidase